MESCEGLSSREAGICRALRALGVYNVKERIVESFAQVKCEEL